MARPKDKSNKSVELAVSKIEILEYNCKGCHKHFNMYNIAQIQPNFCPFCGKRIKEIKCTK